MIVYLIAYHFIVVAVCISFLEYFQSFFEFTKTNAKLIYIVLFYVYVTFIYTIGYAYFKIQVFVFLLLTICLVIQLVCFITMYGQANYHVLTILSKLSHTGC